MLLVPWRRPRSELITSWDALDLLAADWDRLWQARERSHRLCLAYGWVRGMVRFFDGRRGEETRPWCVVLRHPDGRVAGIAPLILEQGTVGRRVRTLPDYVERNHALLHEGDGAALAGEVRRQLDAAGMHGARLRGILRGEAHEQLLGFGASPRVAARGISETEGSGPGSTWWDRRAVRFPAGWEAWLAARGGNYRSSLKRARKRAERAHRVRFWRHSAGQQVCGEPLSVEALCAAIQAVESKAWQNERHFAPQEDGRLMLELLLAAGALELSLLWFDDVPVSYILGHASGRAATTKYLGFDPALAALSPGILCMAELIRTSCEERRLDEINLRGSEHRYKAQLADELESAFELELIGRTPRGLLGGAKRALRPGGRRFGPAAQALVAAPEAAPPRADQP